MIAKTIIYPNVEAMLARLAEDGNAVSESAIREAIQQELDDLAKQMSPHKRVSELMLSDCPLPKTALRDVARGQVSTPESFDVERWKVSSPDEAAPTATEPDETPTE